MGVLISGEGRFEGPTPSQIVSPVGLCCHLANTNDELHGLGTAIASFAELL